MKALRVYRVRQVYPDPLHGSGLTPYEAQQIRTHLQRIVGRCWFRVNEKSSPQREEKFKSCSHC